MSDMRKRGKNLSRRDKRTPAQILRFSEIVNKCKSRSADDQTNLQWMLFVPEVFFPLYYLLYIRPYLYSQRRETETKESFNIFFDKTSKHALNTTHFYVWYFLA